METRVTTIKCAHLGYAAIIDTCMFQYDNNPYELRDVCRGLLSGIKVSEVVLKNAP